MKQIALPKVVGIISSVEGLNGIQMWSKGEFALSA